MKQRRGKTIANGGIKRTRTVFKKAGTANMTQRAEKYAARRPW